MTTTTRLRGVLAPVLTPFDEKLAPDPGRFIAHCRWLVSQGAALAIFGTNSEAASMSVAERLALTEALLEAGVPSSLLMPGTGAAALSDAVELTRHASRHGAAGVLMLPPFYYKNVSEDGVFAYYAEVIERVGSGCAPIYLYHIPQMTQVPITLSLIERLLQRYPQVVAGAKDSSGDWSNAKAMIDTYGPAGFDVFPASETFLSRSLQLFRRARVDCGRCCHDRHSCLRLGSSAGRVRCATRSGRRSHRAPPPAGGVFGALLGRVRRPDVLRHRFYRCVSAGCRIRRPHSARRERCRSSGASTDEVRDHRQSEGCQGLGARDSIVASGACR